jgi:hypothetical protein
LIYAASCLKFWLACGQWIVDRIFLIISKLS